MFITFSNNPIDILKTWIDNTKEKWSHVVWHSKPHHVTCLICGSTVNSKECEWSPNEMGWRQLRNSKRWICHRCDAHRNFVPFIEMVDKDELR